MRGANARGCACEDTNWRTDLESLARSGVRLEGLRREGGLRIDVDYPSETPLRAVEVANVALVLEDAHEKEVSGDMLRIDVDHPSEKPLRAWGLGGASAGTATAGSQA